MKQPFRAPDPIVGEDISHYVERVCRAAADWFNEPISFEISRELARVSAETGRSLRFDIRGPHHIVIGLAE